MKNKTGNKILVRPHILLSLKVTIWVFDYSFSYLLGALKSCNEFHNQYNGVNSKNVEQPGGE